MDDLVGTSERETLPKRPRRSEAARASSSSSSEAAIVLNCAASALFPRARTTLGEFWSEVERVRSTPLPLKLAGGAVLGAKKRESFGCLLAAPFVSGVLRLPVLCTAGLESERRGVLLEPEGKFVRSPSAGLDTESDLIHPVGLIELAEDEAALVLVAAWPAEVCLDTILAE